MADVAVAGRLISDRVWLLEVTGELTPATLAQAATELVSAASEAPRPGLLLIDLRKTTTLSGAGVGLLVELADGTAWQDLTAYVLSPTVPAEHAGGLPVYATPDQAIAAYEEAGTALTGSVPDPAGGDDLTAVSEALARLTSSLLSAPNAQGVLRLVNAAALHLLPQARLVSVTLRKANGELFTPAETDARAVELDQAQYETGLGPCVDTAHPDGPGVAVSEDLRRENRWPRFADTAVGHGFNAVMSTELLPTPDPGRLSGALNIYAADPDAFTETDLATALILATHAALALAGANAREHAEQDRLHLNRALHSRDVIGQAKGILMARRGLSADQAFDLLRRTSQDLNIKLVELAETLTTRHDALDVRDALD